MEQRHERDRRRSQLRPEGGGKRNGIRLVRVWIYSQPYARPQLILHTYLDCGIPTRVQNLPCHDGFDGRHAERR
jgi:hypothetical protein